MRMQQEEKLIETSLEAITSRVQEVRDSVHTFLAKLEREPLNWPSVLDNFALLSGQVSTLTKLLKGDKTPALRNLVLLPVLVQQEQDEELVKISQGRIPAFNHEVVPDHLRTKYEPEVEEAEQSLVVASASITQENAQKQINHLNELLTTLTDIITSAKEDWEGEQNSASRSTSSTNPDIGALVAAVTFGKGLKPNKTTNSSKTRTSTSSEQGSAQWMNNKADQPGKHPSSIKTELKAAASPHPYAGRPPNRS
ncbi:predicted protein [Nematostella vectensis]|uniref:Mediator of RNA polymerase II transcription subunit 8 n=1 Tax=Nematostella vectensis TaxID=45351 RepID=A7SP88_NEMVE|nr:mediator of RNA polymerase II transcription subunit 8 [Nematostella vectensis]EDO34499.1 predicted protein [Nematostella vectensis]|eukprot:XP_001626599.1 predicted protein [Nematostella vectensis]